MRPKPTIILERYNKQTHCTDQIAEAKALYVILYDGAPFNRRRVHTWLNKSAPQYYRVCFAHIGSALRTARILNKIFNTDKFVVYRVASYSPIQGDGLTE